MYMQNKARELFQLFEITVRQRKIMEFMHESVQMNISTSAFISPTHNLLKPSRDLSYCVSKVHSPSVSCKGTEQKGVLTSPDPAGV